MLEGLNTLINPGSTHSPVRRPDGRNVIKFIKNVGKHINSQNSEENDINKSLHDIIRNYPNTKLSKLLEDLVLKTTQKKIVSVLIEIAQRPDVCIDFNVPLQQLLDMYVRLPQDPNLVEAGYLIFSTSKIYSRRVDSNHESVGRIIAGIENSNELNEKRAMPSTIASTSALNNLPKRKVIRVNDHLYEAEVIPKKIKVCNSSKITETVTDLCQLDPPKKFFKEWKLYKGWRDMQTKKMKGYIPYSVVCDDQYIHPAMWNDSSIQDFDYEDDIETKRSFRVFTNYIEYRYNTLVADINFIIHFKVKDFVEAKEDEIEAAQELGLPSEPKRRWPPFCKSLMPLVNEIVDVDMEEEEEEVNRRNNQDYLKNYLELEDAALEQESWYRNENKNQNQKETRNDEPRPLFVNNEQLNCAIMEIDSDNNQHYAQNIENPTNSCHRENEIPVQNQEVQDQPASLAVRVMLLRKRIREENSCYNNVFFRRDDNEIVFFGDLDDTDHLMITPYVYFTDLLPGIEIIPKKIKTLPHFGIDESYLTAREIFVETPENSKIQLRYNIFGIPEERLRTDKLFLLPKEYNLLMKNHFRRTNTNTEEPRTHELFKPFDRDVGKRPVSLDDQEDFFGFSEVEISSVSVCMSKTLHDRTKSRDSGVGLPIAESTIVNHNLSIEERETTFEDSGIGKSLKDPSNALETLSASQNLQIEAPNLNSTMTIHPESLNENIVQNQDQDNHFDLSLLPDLNFLEEDEKILEPFKEPEIEYPNDLKDDAVITERIQNWHKKMRPILSKARERHHFDIFELGTNIIDTFEQNPEGSTKEVTMENVMEGRDPSFISRYLLSVLLLANQGNIKINVGDRRDDKPSPLNKIKLQLLSRKRHTVSVEDNIGIQSQTVSKKRMHTSDEPPCDLHGNINKNVVNPRDNSSLHKRLKDSLDDNVNMQSQTVSKKRMHTSDEPPCDLHGNISNKNVVNPRENSSSPKRHKVSPDLPHNSSSSVTVNHTNGHTMTNNSNSHGILLTNHSDILLNDKTPLVSEDLNLSCQQKQQHGQQKQPTNNETHVLPVIQSEITPDHSIFEKECFIFPKKSKNFTNFTNKTSTHNDDTDSGYHSQISLDSNISVAL